METVEECVVRADEPTTVWRLAGIEEAQPTGGSFAGEFVKMPVRHAAIDELREAEDTALVAPLLLDVITAVHTADFFQAAIAEQGPKQSPSKDDAVHQGSCLFVFVGLADNFQPAAAEFRILIDAKIAVEESLGRVDPLEQAPVSLLQFIRRHIFRFDAAINVFGS